MLEQIRKDVVRTYSSFNHFNTDATRGKDTLQNILICIADIGGIGYIQGLNFIAASVLYHCDVDYSYYIVERLFQAVDAKTLYSGNLREIMVQLNFFFHEYLKSNAPEVQQDLVAKDIFPELIFTEWFVTLGFSIVPMEFHIKMLANFFEHSFEYIHVLLLRFVCARYREFKSLDAELTIICLKSVGQNLKKDKQTNDVKWIEIV